MTKRRALGISVENLQKSVKIVEFIHSFSTVPVLLWINPQTNGLFWSAASMVHRFSHDKKKKPQTCIFMHGMHSVEFLFILNAQVFPPKCFPHVDERGKRIALWKLLKTALLNPKAFRKETARAQSGFDPVFNESTGTTTTTTINIL